MSSSNAAAIRRRVGSQNNLPTATNQSSNLGSIPENVDTDKKENVKTYTMTEMVTLLNSRVVALERGNNQNSTATASASDNTTLEELRSLADEVNIRFELFANEIANMKDTVMKLQTYTMDVNKMLMNERIQILSNVEQSEISEPEFQDLDDSANDVFSNSEEVTSVNVSNLAKEELKNLIA
jgi:hypothetical protein